MKKHPIAFLFKAGLALLLSLELLYFVLIALFLNTPIFHRVVNLDPNELKIDFSRAWSWRPGVIELRGISVEGQDANVIWKVKVPLAQVRIQFVDLLKRQIHLRKFLGEGVAFHLQTKTLAEKKQYPDKPNSMSLEEKKRSHWQLQFDQVELTQVASLGVNKFVYKGEAELGGKLFLWPGVEVEIGPAYLKSAQGSIQAQKEDGTEVALVNHLEGRADVHFEKYDASKVHGAQVFSYLNSALNLNADISSLRYLNDVLIHTDGIALEQSSGTMSASLLISHGEIVPDSQFTIHSNDLSLDLYKWNLEGSGAIEGRLIKDVKASDRQNHEMQVRLNLAHFRAFSPRSKVPLLTGKMLYAEAKSHELLLNHLFENRVFEIGLKESKIENIKAWNAYVSGLPGKVKLLSGSGLVTAKLYAFDGPKRPKKRDYGIGSVQVSLPELHAKLGTTDVQTKFSMNSQIGVINLETKKGNAENTQISFSQADWKFPENVAKSEKSSTVSDWWSEFSLKEVSFSLGSSFSSEGQLEMEMKNSQPLAKIFRESHDIAEWKLNIIASGPAKISAYLSKELDHFRFENIVADVGGLKGLGKMDLSPDNLNAEISLKYGVISAGVKVSDGDTHFRLFPTRGWWQRNESVTEVPKQSSPN